MKDTVGGFMDGLDNGCIRLWWVDTVCGAQITFEHDLSSIFDDDCNMSSCMGRTDRF